MVSKFAFAALFDRPTRVEGEDGLEDWLTMFGGSMFAASMRRAEVRRESRGTAAAENVSGRRVDAGLSPAARDRPTVQSLIAVLA